MQPLRTLTLVLAALIFVGVCWTAIARAQQTAPPSTAAGGVYTEVQATRGQADSLPNFLYNFYLHMCAPATATSISPPPPPPPPLRTTATSALATSEAGGYCHHIGPCH